MRRLPCTDVHTLGLGGHGRALDSLKGADRHARLISIEAPLLCTRYSKRPKSRDEALQRFDVDRSLPVLSVHAPRYPARAPTPLATLPSARLGFRHSNNA